MKTEREIFDKVSELKNELENLDMSTPLDYLQDGNRSEFHDHLKGNIAALRWALGQTSDIFNDFQ